MEEASNAYHVPVLLNESVELLNIKSKGIYVDATFGGGGHSRKILEHLDGGKLFAFDQDEEAIKNAATINRKELQMVESNFRYLQQYLKLYGVKAVDGILADLGVSSHQIDEPNRGFSTRFNGPLDMRMNTRAGITAAEVLNTYTETDLKRIFWQYGEIKNTPKLVNAIIRARVGRGIQTTEELKQVITPLAPRGKEFKYQAQVFQSLRIEVNGELNALKEFLEQAAQVLKPGGRLVILSYHSLEDRLVKHFINKGKFEGEVDKDIYGNELKPLKTITRKAIEPGELEIKINPRARSAKLRCGEKL
jgi:16S rRNA (cytosine1402-N4)-methyltransferase